MTEVAALQTGRRARRRDSAEVKPDRAGATTRYRKLFNPFDPVRMFSDDQIEHIHQSALTVLETIGIRMLLPEAREILSAAGADVDASTFTVRIDRNLVEGALARAPSAFVLHAASPERNVDIGGRNVVIGPVAGPPHVTDLERGRRVATLADHQNLVRMSQHYDVIHINAALAEPQDIPTPMRHYATMRAQLTLSDKVPWVFCRGAPQVHDCFAMLQAGLGLTKDEFESQPHCWTVINTNSPFQLDMPMLQGLIDFARAGQLAVVTPFTLAGAMAPITIIGALIQQHAEALAGIVVSQLAKAGAPVCYGCFTSNVDMKSGSPAFGTPEYVKAAWASGQLARRIGLPWRSSSTTASNTPDAQAAYESQMSLWGAFLGGCNILLHGAGWLEGGLSASFEKFVIDIEMLQMFAEIFAPIPASEDDMGMAAMAAVGPGGHYFDAEHTMSRYRTAFYSPLLSDWSNFGRWQELGSLTATERATRIWKSVLEEFEPPSRDIALIEALDDFIARREREGGAPPESEAARSSRPPKLGRDILRVLTQQANDLLDETGCHALNDARDADGTCDLAMGRA